MRSRKTLHKKQNTVWHMVGGIIGVCMTVLIGMMWIVSDSWRLDQQQKKISTSEQEDVLQHNTQVDIVEEKIGNTVITTYYPMEENQRISSIQAEIDAMVQEMKQDTQRMDVKQHIYVKPYQLEHVKNVRQVVIYQSVYSIESDHLVQQKHEKLCSFYLQEDSKEKILPVRFFTSRAQAELRIAEEVEKVLTENGASDEEKANSKQYVISGLWLRDGFTYANGSFVFQLPEELGNTTIVLPIEQIYAVMNAEYIPDQLAESYASYVAEQEKIKKEQENRMQQSHRRRIALTFDDGPKPSTTPRILDILERFNAKGTFFILGSKVEGNEAILKRMKQAGHELAGHSWSHANFLNLSNDQVKEEMTKTSVAIEQAVGVRPIVFRPPYGNLDGRTARISNAPAILWDVDTEDWKTHDPHAIFKQVKTFAKNGSIVLMHDIHEETVQALPRIIQYLQSEGFELVTIQELFESTPLQTGKGYFSENDIKTF